MWREEELRFIERHEKLIEDFFLGLSKEKFLVEANAQDRYLNQKLMLGLQYSDNPAGFKLTSQGYDEPNGFRIYEVTLGISSNNSLNGSEVVRYELTPGPDEKKNLKESLKEKLIGLMKIRFAMYSVTSVDILKKIISLADDSEFGD